MTKTIHSISSQGGVRLQAYTWGTEENTPLVLLHGYPDNHSVWEGVAELLAEQFYVVAYDVRGAGGSSTPRGRKHYKLNLLKADFTAVVDRLLPNRSFHVAGHDWGSIQCWDFITSEPIQSRTLSYTTISGPCLDHVGFWMRERLNSQGLSSVMRQSLSSWYIAMFQLPVLPELLWKAGLGKLWPTFLAKVEDVNNPEVNPSQASDGALGVWLYRANMVPKLLAPQKRYAHCPIQLLVPTHDRYVNTMLFDDLPQWADEIYRRDIDGNHWITLAETKKVANMINEFVQAVEEETVAVKLKAFRFHSANAIAKEAIA